MNTKYIAVLFMIIGLILQGSNLYASDPNTQEVENQEEIDTKEVIFEHVQDAYEWHILTSFNHRHVSIPLPVIVKSKDRGWFVFISSKLAHGRTHEGFYLSPETGKIMERAADGSGIRPWDFSITKDVCSIFLSCILLLVIFLPLAKTYRKDYLSSRNGFPGVIEMLFVFIYDDLIKPAVGKDYRKFAPYLLTAFFFIFVNNLLGLIPIFPGGVNVTGNIAVTMVLALITFLITNIYGTKEYWKEVFWPDVPAWLKVPLPLMPLIEIIGILTKPFALMVRLFANMLAGHMIILVLISLIFIFTLMMGIVAGGVVAVVSILFSIFMLLIDVLVSFIQAYVFTMLSAIFIGMARVEHSHVKK